MSGGSFDYLFVKDASDILAVEDDVQDMADALSRLEYAQDAATETKEILQALRDFRESMEFRLNRIASVWKGVEWWYSGDSGEDGVREALKEYRQKLEKAEV